MGQSIGQLRDTAAGLLMLIGERRTDARVAACCSLLESALGSEDAGRIASAITGFGAIPADVLRAACKGWTPALHRPDRQTLLAEQQLAEPRRVLSVEVTARTAVPSLRFVLCESDAPIRLEVLEGTSIKDLIDALGKVIGMIAVMYPAMIDATKVNIIAELAVKLDLRMPVRAGAVPAKSA